MTKKLLRFARLAPLALLFAGSAIAQTAGTITGIVTDGSTNTPVIGAVVSASSPALAGEKSTVTDAAGAFTLPGLPPGRYKLSASFEGYKPETRSDLVLGENVTLRANLAIVPEAVKLEEVVVTGSRIKRKDLTAPAPVTLLSKEAMQASGKVSIGDFLQSLPEQGNAINTGVNNGGDGSIHVSLRSLGSQRTLVLVNGRRMVYGGVGASGSVDLASIPTGVIERIEVLKDGASAVYGSDAIAGVVNIITKRAFNGTEVSGYAGTSSRGDGQIVDVSATTGASSDSNSVMFSAGYYKQNATFAGNRDFSKYQFGFDQIDGEYTIGSSRTPGGRISASTAASQGGPGNAAFTALKGAASNAGAAYFIHDPSVGAGNAGYDACVAAGGAPNDCHWRKYDTSGIAGAPGSHGDNYNFAPFNYLQTPAERLMLYAAGDAKLGGSARAYVEASYVNTQARQQLAPEPLIIGPGGVNDPGGNLVKISQYNEFNPFGKDFGTASMRLNSFGFRTHKEDNGTLRAVLGLDGTLTDAFGPLKGWFWDASLNYGRTYGTFTIGGSLISSRIAAALGPSKDGVCYGTYNTTTATYSNPIAGCIPLDLFHGAAAIPSSAVDYLGFNGTSQGANEMTVWQFNTSGELFNLWADRKAGLALGVERRGVFGNFVNDPITAHFDSSNGGSYDTRGSYNSIEGYAELVLPVISNRVGLEDLELSVAGRAFHYSNFGNDKTYKLGGRWKPVKDLTLRGTYSTAFRAPSILDLYAGQFDNFPTVSDPCAGGPAGSASHIDPASVLGQRCGAAANNLDDSTQLRSRNGGNPGLQPETAKIYTAGLVFEPRFAPNFSATVDFYNIEVSNNVTQLGESTILGGCYSPDKPAQYCNLIQRDPATQQINNIFNTNQNVGTEKTSGVDMAMRYNVPTSSAGRFTLIFDGTYLIKHDQTLGDGSVIKGRNTYDLQAASGQGGSNPAFKFNAGAIWGFNGVGAGLTMKYIGGFHECGETYEYDVGVNSADYSGSGLCYLDATFQRKVKAYTAFDLFLSYGFNTMAGKTNVMVGVNNILDANPPKIYNTFASATDQYTYDQMGRFLYARLSQSF
jgi:outer membrane receptor protein involved in Fe transport